MVKRFYYLTNLNNLVADLLTAVQTVLGITIVGYRQDLGLLN